MRFGNCGPCIQPKIRGRIDKIFLIKIFYKLHVKGFFKQKNDIAIILSLLNDCAQPYKIR